MRDKIQVYIDGELTCHHFPRTRTSRSHSGLLCSSWTLEDFFLVWGQGIVSGCFNKRRSCRRICSQKPSFGPLCPQTLKLLQAVGSETVFMKPQTPRFREQIAFCLFMPSGPLGYQP